MENIEVEDEQIEASMPLSRSWSTDSVSSIYSIASSVGSSTSSTREKKYFCDYENCDKSFTRPSLLTEHQLTVHQGVRPFICSVCERSFVKKSHLERHLISHLTEKPLLCSFCGKGFTTRQQLKRHEITHTKSFTCPYPDCNESFYKHPQLRSHVLAVHERKLICEVCGKTFQRPYRLRNHIAKHHNPEVDNPYQCTYMACSKNFKTWSQLQSHIKHDHPKLRCAICSKPCVGENGLQMHMRVHDENLVARNWKCALCANRPFTKKMELISHYLCDHSDVELPSFLQSHSTQEFKLNVDEKETGRMEGTSRLGQKKRKINEFESIRSEIQLEKCLDSGIGATELIINSVGRKLRCPFNNCYRTFKTKERYEKHIHKHKIHQLKLKVLQDKLEKDQSIPNTNLNETKIDSKEEDLSLVANEN